MKSLRKEVKEEWGCCKTEGKATFDVSGTFPLEGKEMLVIFGNRDYSEGVLNVPLDNCAS